MDTIVLSVPTAMLKGALICAGREQPRYYLNGVYVDPRGFLVSTDGHRAFIGKIDVSGVPAFDGWIIPRDAVKRALTAYKNKEIEISRTRCGDIACAPVDGTFPEWQRVLPGEISGVTAQFNTDYLADMGKIGKALGAGQCRAHVHHNGDGPAGVTFPGCEDAFAVLMPLRSSYADADGGVWEQRRRLV